MGNTLSGCGDQFFLVALPWLILQLTGSGAVLGGIMMVEAIPRAALMLLGGAVTDRVSPRKIMILIAAARTASGGRSCGSHLDTSCAGLADLCPKLPVRRRGCICCAGRADLAAFTGGACAITRRKRAVAGHPAGCDAGDARPGHASSSPRFGVASAFSIDAVSFLFIIAAPRSPLRDPPRIDPTVRRANLAHSILEGLRYVKNDVALRSLLLVAAALNFCITGPLSIGLAFLAKSEFGSPTAFGLLVSSVAAGSLVGLLLAAARQQRKRGWLLLAVSAIVAICTSSIGLLSHLWSLLPILFVMSASAGFLNVHLLAWFQQRVDRAVLGRVMSVLMFASLGLVPLSLAAAGVAVQWSLRGMFDAPGALVLIVTPIAGSATSGARDRLVEISASAGRVLSPAAVRARRPEAYACRRLRSCRAAVRHRQNPGPMRA